MQNDQIYSELTNLISTKDDLNLMNSELDLLEASLFETKNPFESVLKNSVAISHALLISQLIKAEDKKQVIEKIRQNLSNVTFVEITLSHDPSQEVLENILIWLRNSLGKNIAVDIKIDRTIIAGALVSYKGKYFDGSVKGKLDSILKNYV